jgi:dynein heavy chain
MENTLKNLEITWKDIDFDFRAHADVFLIGLNEDNFNMLEEN